MNKPGLVHLERKVEELQRQINEQDARLKAIKKLLLMFDKPNWNETMYKRLEEI